GPRQVALKSQCCNRITQVPDSRRSLANDFDARRDPCPCALELLRRLDRGKRPEARFRQAVSNLALLGLLRLQFVAEGHELVHFGDDALLLGEGWPRQQNLREVALVKAILGRPGYRPNRCLKQGRPQEIEDE